MGQDGGFGGHQAGGEVQVREVATEDLQNLNFLVLKRDILCFHSEFIIWSHLYADWSLFDLTSVFYTADCHWVNHDYLF